MPRIIPLGALLLTLALPAMAAETGPSETHLLLSESATVMVAPDEIAASLRAEAVAGTAAEAQKRVNDMIRDALAVAKQTAGVTASTGGYGVWRDQQNGADRWQGSQMLSLTGHDGAALLTLVGTLQQKGLAVGGLNWHLARETERQAHRDATQKALSTLRTRADEAAAVLGLKFSRFASVRLDGVPSPPPRPMGMMAVAAGRAAEPPPSAAAEDIPVTASVEADALLLPR